MKDGPDDVGALVDLLYQELRVLASRTLRQRRGQPLQITSLVHECYERLSGADVEQFADRAHFLATAGRAMRFILTDRVRHRMAEKRGGGLIHIRLDEQVVGQEPTIDLLALEQALTRLELADPRCATVVQMRLLAGMTVAEVAMQMELSVRTVEREWRAGRAFLLSALGDGC